MSRFHHSRARFYASGVCAFLAAVLLAACSSAAKQPSDATAVKSGNNVSITLAGSAGGGILPAFAAQQEGYFAKHGLNVTIKTVTNPTTLVAGLGHQFQLIETYATTVISAASSGISIAAVAGGELTTPKAKVTETLVKPGSGITSFLQLQGKRVGTPTVNGLIPVGLLALIKEQGGDPSSVHLLQVPFTSQEAELNSGRVDAILSALPYYSTLITDGYRPLGDPDLALAGASNNNAVLGSLWAASRSWASQNPKIVSEFIAAINEADKWIAAHSSAAKQLYVKISGLNASLVTSSPLPEYKATVSLSDVAPWVNYMKEAGQLNGHVDNSQLVFP